MLDVRLDGAGVKVFATGAGVPSTIVGAIDLCGTIGTCVVLAGV